MRLLQHTSISDAAEEMLISKMKIELGAQHVAKYVQMGVDMKNSRDQTDMFKKQVEKGIVSGVELTTKVLTSGLWGNEQNVNCQLPEELKSCCDKFDTFYKSVHTGRHLVWNAGIGDCELKANSFSKPYTFILTVYQTSILMLFNTQDSYTFGEIKDRTKLPEDVLTKQIFNLINPKLGKILIKGNMKTPKLTLDEKISLNDKFAAATLRMSLIPAPVRKVFHKTHFNRKESTSIRRNLMRKPRN